MRYVLRIASTEFVLPPMYNAGATVDALVRMLSMSVAVKYGYNKAGNSYERDNSSRVEIELRTVRDDADEVVGAELALAGETEEEETERESI